MGSSHSRREIGERHTTLRARLARRRGGTDTKSSQLSEMLPEILEMIFSYLVEGSDASVPRSTLVTIARVNRHWAHASQALLYRSITITRARELTLLLRTISKSKPLESTITCLRFPELIEAEPLRTHNQAGFRISVEQQRKEEQASRNAVVADVLRLLSIPTNLRQLELHADNAPLYLDRPDANTQSTRRLTNLVTLTTLTLHGRHDGRWLFLMKFAPHLTSLRVSPCWGWEHSTSLPFTNYNLRSLHLTNDQSDEHSDNRLTPIMFENLVTAPLLSPRRSISSLDTNVRNLTLIDVPILQELRPHLAFLAPTLETLHIAYNTPHTRQAMTSLLEETLPLLTSLTSLHTNAGTEGLMNPPDSLTSLTISLKGRPAPAPTESPHVYSSSIPSYASDPQIGSIYSTIMTILDSSSCSAPGRLKNLTIVDPTMSDFLHFHLVSDSYGNPSESQKQNRLWMKAGQMGVLVNVVKPQSGMQGR